MSDPNVPPAAVDPASQVPAPAATPAQTPTPTPPVQTPPAATPPPTPGLVDPGGPLPMIPQADIPTPPAVSATTQIEFVGPDGQPQRASISELVDSHRVRTTAANDPTAKQVDLYKKAMAGDGDALTEFLSEIGVSQDITPDQFTSQNVQQGPVELPDEVKEVISNLQARVDRSEAFVQQAETAQNHALMSQMVGQFKDNLPLVNRMGPQGVSAVLTRVRQIAEIAAANPQQGVNPHNPDHQMRIIVKAMTDAEHGYRRNFLAMGGTLPEIAPPPPQGEMVDDQQAPRAGYIPPSMSVQGGQTVPNPAPGLPGQIPAGSPGGLPQAAAFPPSTPPQSGGPMTREQMTAAMRARTQEMAHG